MIGLMTLKVLEGWFSVQEVCKHNFVWPRYDKIYFLYQISKLDRSVSLKHLCHLQMVLMTLKHLKTHESTNESIWQ